MSAQRDELAAIIASPERVDGGPVSCGPNSVYAARTADAILAEYLLIRRAELPEVRDSDLDANMYYTDNENVVYTSEANARMWVMRDIAVWQHIARKEDAYAAKRRDELAVELTQDDLNDWAYAECSPRLQRAIDRIIELEARVSND
jgi:hypothetical protein